VPELLDYGIPLNDAPIPPTTTDHDKDKAAMHQELELATEYNALIPPTNNNHDEDEAAMHQELELTAESGRDDAAMLLLFASNATAVEVWKLELTTESGSNDAAILLLFVSNATAVEV
jgi:hypothetical protein